MSISSEKLDITVRKANTSDLSDINILIMQSFEAMIPHSCLPSSFWRGAADKLKNSELFALEFYSKNKLLRNENY